MNREPTRSPSGEWPDNWPELLETDPGFWDDAPDSTDDPFADVPPATAARWRGEANRERPGKKRRRSERKERGGWGSYPNT